MNFTKLEFVESWKWAVVLCEMIILCKDVVTSTSLLESLMMWVLCAESFIPVNCTVYGVFFSGELVYHFVVFDNYYEHESCYNILNLIKCETNSVCVAV